MHDQDILQLTVFATVFFIIVLFLGGRLFKVFCCMELVYRLCPVPPPRCSYVVILARKFI